jgi:PhnB protein
VNYQWQQPCWLAKRKAGLQTLVDFNEFQGYERLLRARVTAQSQGAKRKRTEVPMTVQAIPQGFHSLTPGLTCKDAAKAIEVYKKAFGATERSRFAGPDGRIMHAELQIGDSMIFLADEFPGMSAAPTQGAPPSQAVYMYVPNVDATYDQAVAAGCQGAMPVSDMFWGDRFGKVIDPFGHHWNLATHTEDVAPAEMERRGKEWMAKMASMAKSAGQS